MLLEREELLESLRGHLASADSGYGSMVLVAGEAGAGKSSLVRAFIRSLGPDTLVIEGACDPLTTPRPLGPLYDFAADPDSGLADLAPGAMDAIEVFAAVLDRLRQTIRPIVMVIEDIHWADEGTLDFLRFIGRRVADTKAVVVCTYRDDEVAADHEMRPLLGQLIPLDSTHRLLVGALSPGAVRELAAGHDVDPIDLYRLCEGNAFFVTEVIAAGTTLPRTVQDAVLSRVALLQPASHRAVEAVAIAPRHLEIEKTEALVGVTPEDIDRAVGSGVLLGDNGSVRFRHELARAAVEAAIPPARRLQMHRRMIGLLEEDEGRDVARLAHHAIRAESPDLIVEYAPEAAADALSRGARREAIAFYRAALQHPAQLGPSHEAGLRVLLGTELRLVDKPEESVEILMPAIDHYRESGDAESLANALGLLQGALWNIRRFDEGWAAMNEAMAVLATLGPSETLATTLYRASHNHMLARHAEAAFEHVERARDVADQVGSSRARWLAKMMTGCIHIVVGDPDEGARILEESVAEAEVLGEERFLAIALGMLGSGGGEARLYERAIPALERGIEQGVATDEDYQVAYDRSWLARIAFEQGRWEDAVEYASLVDRTTMQKTGIAAITAMSALGRVRVRRGDPGGLPLLEEMIAIGAGHELQHVWNAVCGKAEHWWLRGRMEESLADLESLYQRALDTDSQWARGEIGFWMWRAGAIDGPPERAANPFALQMSGHWRESADAWRGIGCPYEVALALADGDDDAMLEAVSIFDSLGAKPAADMTRARLRAAGAERIPRRPTERTRSNPGELTDRQMEVLGLLSRGLSNSEIADELFLSKKTVEHHVSAIFSKLGVTTRARAIAAAADIEFSPTT